MYAAQEGEPPSLPDWNLIKLKSPDRIWDSPTDTMDW
jgi:hypothetical protein